MMNLDILREMPVDFVDIVFNEKIWSKQQQIIESVRDNKYTTVRSCFDAGKSFIAARTALWFLYSFPNSKVITTAPTFRQVKDILWTEIAVAKKKAKAELKGVLNDTSLTIADDWFAIGMSTNDPTSFQGYHAVNILVIVDEAAGVDEQIYNASEGLLSSENARALYIGNPTNIQGTFFKSFKLPSYRKLHISTFDTPNFTEFGITLDDIRNNTWKEKITKELPAPYLVTPEWTYDKYIRWGETSPMFQAMVLGEFPEQGEDTLIPLDKIELATRAHLEIKDTDPEHTGVDIARFGVDKTEFCYRKGSKVKDWKTFSHMDTVQTIGHLRTFMGFHPHSAVSIDEVGVGAGVLDNVKGSEPMRNVLGINVGLPSHDPEMFLNIRAEYFWNLRERFVNGDIDLSEVPMEVLEELVAQLSSIKFEYTPKGQIKIESKEDMKKRGLPSPDKADALALAFGMVQSEPALFGYYKQATQ